MTHPSPAWELPLERLLAVHADGGRDEGAWRDVLVRFGPAVRAWLRGQGATPEELEDLASATWLRVLSSLPSLRDPESFPGWLRVVTRNVFNDFVRAEAGRRDLEQRAARHGVPGTGDPTPDPAASLELASELARVRVRIAGLPDRDRRVLEHLDAGMTASASAAVLGMTAAWVSDRRYKLVRRLREEGT